MARITHEQYTEEQYKVVSTLMDIARHWEPVDENMARTGLMLSIGDAELFISFAFQLNCMPFPVVEIFYNDELIIHREGVESNDYVWSIYATIDGICPKVRRIMKGEKK